MSAALALSGNERIAKFGWIQAWWGVGKSLGHRYSSSLALGCPRRQSRLACYPKQDDLFEIQLEGVWSRCVGKLGRIWHPSPDDRSAGGPFSTNYPLVFIYWPAFILDNVFSSTTCGLYNAAVARGQVRLGPGQGRQFGG